MDNRRFTGDDHDALAEALDPQWPGPIPHTLFIAPGGKVLYRKTGEFDALELRRTIADHLGRTYANRKKAAPTAGAGESEEAFGARFRKAAAEFLNGLPADQAAACIRPFDKAARWTMQYTGGPREGLVIRNLAPAARTALESTMQMVLSPYGWEQAQAVAKQDGPEGLGKYYVTFFGDPRTGGDFAWRISEHHITVLHLEVEKGRVTEFGPILLGADPPVLWREEEEQVLALWAALGEPPAIPMVKGRAIASEALPVGIGTPVRDLPPAARRALDAVWAGRLKVFADPVRARIERLVAARGGIESLRTSFHNAAAEKRCSDGGRWDWKLGGDGVLLDFETSRGHIHMSLWIR
jgi:hypothetical protein